MPDEERIIVDHQFEHSRHPYKGTHIDHVALNSLVYKLNSLVKFSDEFKSNLSKKLNLKSAEVSQYILEYKKFLLMAAASRKMISPSE